MKHNDSNIQNVKVVNNHFVYSLYKTNAFNNDGLIIVGTLKEDKKTKIKDKSNTNI